jgi:predicted metalloprotease with PDZ domain
MRHALSCSIAASLSIFLLAGCAQSQTMRLRVDATDLPRHLVRAEAVIPVELLNRDAEGRADIWYVEWVPGNHNPSNPIQNLVEFRATDDRGRTLKWSRNYAHTVHKTIEVPGDAKELRLSYAYIASQPWVNSRSSDTYGRPNLGVLSFNNVLFYPDGANKNTLVVDAEVLLPDGWSASTSLMPPGRHHEGSLDGRPERVDLPPAPLATYVDSPMIAGEHYRVWDMESLCDAPHTFEAVAPEADSLELPDARLVKFDRMIAETQAVFGPFPWDQFRFLIVLSDDMPGFGLEHRESTLIRYGTTMLVDCERTGASMNTVPHEYIHVWVGKLRAQEGLLHDDYHTPGDTRMMWVYEGLTSYYDEVIAARSGLSTFDQFRDGWIATIERYMLQPGRLWRSVEDTGAGLRHLRETSPRFESLRRRQDYYGEGSLFWMEADAIIRGATDNEKSLDDFSRAFFSVEKPEGAGDVVEHSREDVVRALTEVYSGADWDALIRERIETPRDSLDFDSLARSLGYRLEHHDEPFTAGDVSAAKGKSADLRSSLGITVRESGEIQTLLDSPAWRAGLGYDMKIVGVKTPESGDSTVAYTAAALRDAVRRSAATGEVELLVDWGGQIRPVHIAYDGGLRYLALVPIEGKPDLLREIARPRTVPTGDSSVRTPDAE